jgi:putrescine transport system ATP-binding protein
MFEGVVIEDEPDHVRIRSTEAACDIYVPHGVDCAPDQVLWYAIRPEKIVLSRERPKGDANITKGMVEDIAYLGDMSVFQVVLENGKRMRVTKANSLRGDPDAIKWDEEVYLHWKGDSGSVLTV